MKCLVCSASFTETACPQCGFNPGKDPSDSSSILAAREAFKDKVSAYAPEKRVTRKDRWLPWIGTMLGFLIFLLWLKACSSFGRHMFW